MHLTRNTCKNYLMFKIIGTINKITHYLLIYLGFIPIKKQQVEIYCSEKIKH